MGLSGGLDSVCLLHLLANSEHAFSVEAVHVHHGLSPNADAWAAHCEALCSSLELPCSVVKVQVPRDSGLGLEAAARAERYKAFERVQADAWLLAHHQDDQAETVLLQLLRGAGVQGLSAMAVERALANGVSAFRPLLGVSKASLREYAERNQLTWVEDESNADAHYDRNFLRLNILPALEQRFPAAKQVLARSAQHLAESAQLLEEVAQDDAVHAVKSGRLDLAFLSQLSQARATNLLRFWLSSVTPLPLTTARLQNAMRQLLNAKQNALISIKLGQGYLHRYQGEAWFEPGTQQTEAFDLPWQGETNLQLPHGTLHFVETIGQGLAVDKIDKKGWHIRSRQGGERIKIDPKRPTRTLKHWLQDANIPPWQRESLPLLLWKDTLVAVPSAGVAVEYQAAEGAAGYVLDWQPGVVTQ